jgi:hypothetical protein
MRGLAASTAHEENYQHGDGPGGELERSGESECHTRWKVTLSFGEYEPEEQKCEYGEVITAGDEGQRTHWQHQEELRQGELSSPSELAESDSGPTDNEGYQQKGHPSVGDGNGSGCRRCVAEHRHEREVGKEFLEGGVRRS